MTTINSKETKDYTAFTILDKDMPVDGPIFVNLEEVGLGETIRRCKNSIDGILVRDSKLHTISDIKKFISSTFKHYPNSRIIIIDSFTTDVVYDSEVDPDKINTTETYIIDR